MLKYLTKGQNKTRANNKTYFEAKTKQEQTKNTNLNFRDSSDVTMSNKIIEFVMNDEITFQQYECC